MGVIDPTADIVFTIAATTTTIPKTTGLPNSIPAENPLVLYKYGLGWHHHIGIPGQFRLLHPNNTTDYGYNKLAIKG